MITTQLIIIGSGPGGYRAAEYAVKNGLNVIIFEGRNVGGTCLNEGCIPTKSLTRNAEVLQTLKDAEVYGLENLQYDFDFSQVIARKDGIIQTLRSGIESLLSQPHITLVRDTVTFKDCHTLIATHSGEEYTAENIIIATGSAPKIPSRMEIDADAICDSTQLLSIDHIPKRLCIIGAGVIGMEFASIFNAFGCEVTIVEFLKECLPAIDEDIAKRLRKSLEKRGVTFSMQSGVKSVKKADDGSSIITFERKGKELSQEADVVLMAVGRKPIITIANNTDIDCDERTGIHVDENMETSVKGIYAIGDCNGHQMLAHAAAMQGIHAVNHILGQADNIRFDVMPAAVFTQPEVASVGLTQEQCKEKGLAVNCCKAFYRANGKALTMNENEGLLKLFVSADGQLLGCHVMGAHAADIIQEVTALMAVNATAAQLKDIIHTHPTLGELLQDAIAQLH